MRRTANTSLPHGSLILSVVLITESPAWHLRDALTMALTERASRSELVVIDGAADAAVRWIVDDVLATSGTGNLSIPGGGTLLRSVSELTIGQARARGQDLAAGRHVLHLDARTILHEGAMSRLIDALASDDPAVLLLEADEVRWWGRSRPRVWRAAVSSVNAGETTSANGCGWVEALLKGPIDVPAWTVREDVADQAGAAWSGDRFADRGWLLRLALRGSGVQALSDPLLEIHRRTPNVEQRSRSAVGHDLFAEAGHVLTSLGDTSALPAARLIERTLRDALRMLDEESMWWSASERWTFFRSARRELRPHLRNPVGLGGPRASALVDGSFPRWKLLDTARRLRNRTLATRPTAAREARSWKDRALSVASWAARRLPLQRDLVVFSAYGGRSVSCSPLALQHELERQAPWVRCVWVLRRGVRCPPGIRCARPGTARYHLATGRAKILINNYNFDDRVPRRRRTLNVQTQHGTPLKTVGVDQHRFPGTAGGATLTAFVRRYSRWDIVLSPSYHASEVLHRSFPGRFVIHHTGLPRNDVLLRDGRRTRAQVRARLGIEEGELAVLFVPTFRDGRGGSDPREDVESLAGHLGPNTAVLLRSHHFERRPVTGARHREAGARVLDVSDEPAIEALYLASDVLVTDYSSAMFDYSLLGRPIVLYQPDLDHYQARRGLYLDLAAVGPGPLVTNVDELADALREVNLYTDASLRRLAAFRARYAEFEDGHAAERVVRELMLPVVGHRRRRGWRTPGGP